MEERQKTKKARKRKRHGDDDGESSIQKVRSLRFQTCMLSEDVMHYSCTHVDIVTTEHSWLSLTFIFNLK